MWWGNQFVSSVVRGVYGTATHRAGCDRNLCPIVKWTIDKAAFQILDWAANNHIPFNGNTAILVATPLFTMGVNSKQSTFVYVHRVERELNGISTVNVILQKLQTQKENKCMGNIYEMSIYGIWVVWKQQQ